MNIEDGRTWCNESDCKKYYDKGFRGARPNGPCYESRLFKDWEFGAGWDIYGGGDIRFRRIKQAEQGDIAIFTTRFPNEPERDRKIIGLFKIADVKDSNKHETIITADSDYCIKLPTEEANELFFWDYYSNEDKGQIKWGQGLYRYLDDYLLAQILLDLDRTIRKESERTKIGRLLDELDRKINLEKVPQPSGARIGKGTSRVERINVSRKYGSCGEGQSHKDLKMWIKNNPDFLGLTNVVKVEVEEHSFPSGDLPDIVFTLEGNQFAAVEIETNNTWPGAYQALKYKSLLCAEKRLSLDSTKVRSFLVAWEIPDDVKKFCQQYGINYKEKYLNPSTSKR